MTLQRLMAPTFTATHSVVGTLDVKSATISLDETRAPYAQAVLTCAAPSGAIREQIDSRLDQRVVIQLDDQAVLFGNPSEQRSFDLVLHSSDAGASSGELILTCYSDESRLIDKGLLLANTKDWAQGTVQLLVRAVLTYLGFTNLPASPNADIPIAAAAAVQSPGQKYWDFLSGTVQGAGLRLWCDELRVWHLDDKAAIAPGQTSLSYLNTITGLNDSVGTDDLGADSLVVRYSYITDAGNAETAYDVAGDLVSSLRTAVVDFASRPGVAGAARRLLRRVKGRGRTISPEAVSRYLVTPTQSLVITPPDGARVQTGLVSSVSWAFPSDRMVLTSRELTDTATTAWSAQPQGRTWASVPAGVSWQQIDAVPWTAGAVGKTWAGVPAGYRWNEMKEYVNG